MVLYSNSNIENKVHSRYRIGCIQSGKSIEAKEATDSEPNNIVPLRTAEA
jgi:hypothetical protein